MKKRQVDLIIDRPLGSVHPNYPDCIYPVNYGYVKDIMANDGEEQDAYLLGVCEPVRKFRGTLIAIIHRKNDVEDKWVVVPENMEFSKEEIEKQTYFQEQYFETEIWMMESDER